MSVQTIEEVIVRLDALIDEGLRSESRIGYFAALYQRVTLSVRRAILAGDVFEDNPRMARLDVLFANRFLDAYDTYVAGGTPTMPWKLAFDDLKNRELMVVQHLLLGMNAHITLDLCIAAYEVQAERKQPMLALKNDFDMINVVLARLTDIVMVQLGQLSPTFKLMDKIAPELQALLFGQVLNVARDEAWGFAMKLSRARGAAARALLIKQREAYALTLSKLLEDTPGFDKFVHKVAAEEARKGIRYNIQIVAE